MKTHTNKRRVFVTNSHLSDFVVTEFKTSMGFWGNWVQPGARADLPQTAAHEHCALFEWSSGHRFVGGSLWSRHLSWDRWRLQHAQRRSWRPSVRALHLSKPDDNFSGLRRHRPTQRGHDSGNHRARRTLRPAHSFAVRRSFGHERVRVKNCFS